MKKYQLLLIVSLSMAAVPAGLAAGCCETPMAGCSMSEQQAPTVETSAHRVGAGQIQAQMEAATRQPALTGVAKTVFDNYIKVQTALAQDSLKEISGSAGVLAQAVQADQKKVFPAQVSEQADALAKAKDLDTARTAFKSLSQSLITYCATNKAVAASYVEAYCPMVQASWLQLGKTLNNPYMGKAMLRCGQIKS